MENKEFVDFLGWKGTYARFRIKRGRLPDGRSLQRIVVAHEGNWIDMDHVGFEPAYDTYEDVQKAMGEGLTFVAKEYSTILKRSLFEYVFEEYRHEAILAVPATGEEIYFEIYGRERHHGLILLVEREL